MKWVRVTISGTLPTEDSYLNLDQMVEIVVREAKNSGRVELLPFALRGVTATSEVFSAELSMIQHERLFRAMQLDNEFAEQKKGEQP